LAEKKFKDLLDSAPDATVIFNTEGVIDLVNNQVENVFGYAKEELVGENFSKLIKNKVKEITAITAQSFFEQPKMKLIEGLEVIGEHKTNGKFVAEISVAPIETEEGILFSAAIRDITLWKKEQKTLEEYNIQLETKNKELEQFTYIASHDLQEPLITLRSLIDLIKEESRDAMDTKTKNAFGYISDTTLRMSELIKGLLDYGRIGQNRVLKTVDCQRLVNEVQKDLATRILETKAVIEVEKLPEIQGYEIEMRMLFQNLIVNALKFQRPGQNPLIQISAQKEGEFWLFAVADNGIGIEEENKDRIFTIFQRLHKRAEYEGTGIGLAHCRKIVELHWGKIWVESKQNEGIVFYFTIKL
jgi:PAS domain S-box-containing protein